MASHPFTDEAGPFVRVTAQILVFISLSPQESVKLPFEVRILNHRLHRIEIKESSALLHSLC